MNSSGQVCNECNERPSSVGVPTPGFRDADTIMPLCHPKGCCETCSARSAARTGSGNGRLFIFSWSCGRVAMLIPVALEDANKEMQAFEGSISRFFASAS